MEHEAGGSTCGFFRGVSTDDEHLLETSATSEGILYGDPYGHNQDEVTRCCIEPIGAMEDFRDIINFTTNVQFAGKPKFGASSRAQYPAGRAPKQPKDTEHYGCQMITMPNLHPEELVRMVVAFFEQLGWPKSRELFNSNSWEIVFSAFTNAYSCACSPRLLFYAHGDAGSAVEFHRDADCPFFAAELCTVMRDWLEEGDIAKQVGVDLRWKNVPVIALNDDSDNWDWLDGDEIDRELTLKLAKQQSSLEGLRDKLQPRMQDIIDRTCPRDIGCLAELLDELLDGRGDYLDNFDIISLCRLACGLTEADQLRLLRTLEKITSPLPSEAIAHLTRCRSSKVAARILGLSGSHSILTQ
eukprot:GEMP01017919.1.p1 GENE.GEMP01017919.1~~GEMP01017919.1.p1  ORF type:complete len:356 (+),score=75.56 GEMP01017919.1:95-1162(+)